MRGKIAFALNVFFLTLVLPSLGAQRRCHVAWFRTFHTRADTCIVKFAHREPLPSWLDKLQLEKSLTDASDEELDALAKDVCSCAFFRVMRSCPAPLYEIMSALSWRCFPGARGHVMQRLAAAVERKRKSPTPEDSQKGDDKRKIDVTDSSSGSEVPTEAVETGSEESQIVTSNAAQTDDETAEAEDGADSPALITTDFSLAPVDGAQAGDNENVKDEPSVLEVIDDSDKTPSEDGSPTDNMESNQATKIGQQNDDPELDRLNPDAEGKESNYDADTWKNF